MKVIPTYLQDLVVLEPEITLTKYGYFLESFSTKEFNEKVTPINFVQDNESCSMKGVARGLHFQKPPYAQSKLIKCVKGKVLDIVLDLRSYSSTYGKMLTVELSEENHRALFIPKGFAHGFIVMSDNTITQYKCDEFYHPECEGGVNIFEPDLNILSQLKIDPSTLIISEKDKALPFLKNFHTPFFS